jgi:hypothetical protein
MAQNLPWTLDLGQITGVSATLTRPAGQMASGQFSGTLNLGGFAIGLSAAARGSNAGWLLNGYAEQPTGSYVPVGDFLSDLATKLGISVPDALVQAVQSLRIANLTITLDTQSKAFSFNGDTDAKGQTPLGLNTYELDLRVNVSSAVDPATKQRISSGHLEADLTIGAAPFVLSFDFGPVSDVSGSWVSIDGETLDLGDLAQAIGITDAVTIPAGLDLALVSVSFTYSATQRSFILSARSKNYGEVIFAVSFAPARPVFVLGVEVPIPNGHLFDLPGIGNDLSGLDFITFKEVAILLASGGAQTFVVPSSLPKLPPAPVGTAPGQLNRIAPFAPGTPLLVGPSVTLAAAVIAGNQNDPRIGHLVQICSVPQLLLQVTIGTAEVVASCQLSGSATIPTGGGQHLTLQNAAVEIAVQATPVPVTLVQLTGSMNVIILNTPIAASARVSISDTEADRLHHHRRPVRPEHRISIPPGLGPFDLPVGSLSMQEGVVFVPAGVDLGLQGAFQLGIGSNTQSCDFGIILEMIGEVPNPLYLSFAISDLTLGEMLLRFRP